MSKIPTSLFGRGTKILGMAARAAITEASLKLKNWEDENDKLKARVKLAGDLVKTLSELKGASMKVGQLLSLDAGDYLPPEILKVLETLQSKSTFLPWAQVEEILKKELGDKYYRLKAVSREPIAAASIGQVHSAVIDGRRIVLKIQYPGIAESIPSDLRLLDLILRQLALFSGKTQTDLSPLLEEVRAVLTRETDYSHELSMHLRYLDHFRDSEFMIPGVLPEFSTKKILAVDFVEGISFTDWLAAGPPVEIRQRFAGQLVELYLRELFVHGLVQTDPNPGNFLVTSEHKLALLDFGAAKLYERSFISGYRKILLAGLRGDGAAVLEESEALGLIDPREDKDVKARYLEMMDFLVAPFRMEEEFDFTDRSFFERSRDLSWELSKELKYTAPPKDLLFLHRKLGGIFVLIKKMDVKIRLKDYWTYVADS